MKKIYIDSGDDSITKYFKEVKKSQILTPDEELELAKRIVDGDEIAKNKLIKSNLKFVISVAKEYQGQGLALSDLINEGNLGLIKAASRFNHTKGFRFISYAVWWIKASIMQSLNDNSRTIRLPSNVITKMSQIKKEIANLEFNGDIEDIEYVSSLPKCASLNKTINEDGGELYELLEDKNLDDDAGFYELDVRIKDELTNVLSTLTDRERTIIECYYGIDKDFEPMTLESIGDRYSITKERVRQIKEKAIRKIRHNAHDLFDALYE
jgi:RNA polymerase primary sigma factor